MKICESQKHEQIVFDESYKCPFCALHQYVDDLEIELQVLRKMKSAEEMLLAAAKEAFVAIRDARLMRTFHMTDGMIAADKTLADAINKAEEALDNGKDHG